MADDPCDIKLDLEKKCLADHCTHDVEHYNQCLERIKVVPQDLEPHCFPQYFEVIHCVDHCVEPLLWKTLQ